MSWLARAREKPCTPLKEGVPKVPEAMEKPFAPLRKEVPEVPEAPFGTSGTAGSTNTKAFLTDNAKSERRETFSGGGGSAPPKPTKPPKEQFDSPPKPTKPHFGSFGSTPYPHPENVASDAIPAESDHFEGRHPDWGKLLGPELRALVDAKLAARQTKRETTFPERHDDSPDAVPPEKPSKPAPMGLSGNKKPDSLDQWIARDYAKRKAEFDRVKAAVLAHKDGTK